MVKKKIYVAGPSFSAGEKYEQKLIAYTLKQNGYETYPVDWESGGEFNCNLYQLSLCSGVVANVNGLEPDANTAISIALAFAMGKAIVLFKDDTRVLPPAVSALATVAPVFQFTAIPIALNEALSQTKNSPVEKLNKQLKKAIDKGKKNNKT
ncbi:MAG: hypothetical protein Harvfovirus15_4 [Harvfovirus sp.]|uniref:Nucleoside 2-deoxyribosyltransferase n=1 Tax=Harvfovirus sp. TaxID=2487768 RepID=A0A3G5A1Q8_9VIRU|nr:MAG: hypothetical protein Harvfovirus15_4 [Harvfovirus sp.]